MQGRHAKASDFGLGGHDMKANEPISIKSISNVGLICLGLALGLVAAVWGVLGIFVL